MLVPRTWPAAKKGSGCKEGGGFWILIMFWDLPSEVPEVFPGTACWCSPATQNWHPSAKQPPLPAPAFLSWVLRIHPTYSAEKVLEEVVMARLKRASVRNQLYFWQLVIWGMCVSGGTDLGDPGVLFLKVLYLFIRWSPAFHSREWNVLSSLFMKKIRRVIIKLLNSMNITEHLL